MRGSLAYPIPLPPQRRGWVNDVTAVLGPRMSRPTRNYPISMLSIRESIYGVPWNQRHLVMPNYVASWVCR